jgi:hypothetical protein
MIVGAIFQNVLNSVFNNNSGQNQKKLDAKQQADELAKREAAHKAAEQQRINAAIAQAEYEKMMRSYKLLDDSESLQIKTLNSTGLDFKTLDSDPENLASNAAKQFENASIAFVSTPPEPGKATPFFGDTMPVEDIQILLSPETKPEIADLREATKYLSDNNKKDSLGFVALLRKPEPQANSQPLTQKPDCKNLTRQLEEYINQRQQFQKTIDLSQNEVDVWETANRNAMMNAAKDGLEYFTGQWMEALTKRGKAADRLQQIYDKNVKQMAKDGIDIAAVQSKIEKLRNISSAGQIADFASNINDWQTFIKDGMSSQISKLTDSNTEIKDLLDEPEMKEYFETEKADLNTLLDISKIASSNLVFGKWVAKKIPLIACIEISIKQVYNGTDYLLSLNRIINANKINGTVLETARRIQKNIDETSRSLNQCF